MEIDLGQTVPDIELKECPKKVNCFLTNIFSMIDAPNILKTIVFLGNRNGNFRYCDYIMGLLEFQIDHGSVGKADIFDTI